MAAALTGTTACGGPSDPGVATANGATTSASASSAPQNEQVQMEHFAQCMCQHGQNVPDPDPATGKSKFEGRLAHASKTQIANDPQVTAAQNACKDKLNVPANGSGNHK